MQVRVSKENHIQCLVKPYPSCFYLPQTHSYASCWLTFKINLTLPLSRYLGDINDSFLLLWFMKALSLSQAPRRCVNVSSAMAGMSCGYIAVQRCRIANPYSLPRFSKSVASRLPAEGRTNDSSTNKDWSSQPWKMYRKQGEIMQVCSIRFKLEVPGACEGLSVFVKSLYCPLLWRTPQPFVSTPCSCRYTFSSRIPLMFQVTSPSSSGYYLHPVVAHVTKLIHTPN